MKDYGVDRTVESGSVEYNARMAEVQAMLASGLYSSVEMRKDGRKQLKPPKNGWKRTPTATFSSKRK